MAKPETATSLPFVDYAEPMGALDVTLGVSGNSDRKRELHNEIWNHIVGFVTTYVDEDLLDVLLEYISEARFDEPWGVQEGAANFFHPESGAVLPCAGRGASVRCYNCATMLA